MRTILTGKGGTRILPLVFLLLLGLLPAGCSREEKARKEEFPPEKVTEREKPEFGEENERYLSHVVLEKLDGTSVKISDYQGKLLFVTFWSSWHKESLKMIPIMNELHRKFHRNVVVLGVAVDKDGAASVKKALKDQPVNFEVFINGYKIVNQFGGAGTMPTSYVLLRDGRLVWRINGLRAKDKYSEIILSLYRRHL
ncbi:MAG: TlpA family protein disulfide reductase [Candidatus Krumholzibacteriota bacterium]|nr:TlpA family protein disulfide reductase [Candidatus Krumholzibacteriota bacterium]